MGERRPRRRHRRAPTHQRQQTREAAAEDWRGYGLAFGTPAGGPIDPANLNRGFRTLLDRVGLRSIRFHALRRCTATLILEQGVEPVVTKVLLGHAYIGVTATVYANPWELHLMGVKLQVARSERQPTGTLSPYNLAA
ncbi:tyrosine-type recombinase/integrase [Kitasatospora purpeofusca]|uniref:tyrosine-type recombinase/integrase n=1 Tax=Kitasatospora purpeofusca TaxID=67352 RepID=UPI0038601823